MVLKGIFSDLFFWKDALRLNDFRALRFSLKTLRPLLSNEGEIVWSFVSHRVEKEPNSSSEDVITLLIEEGWDINQKFPNGYTPLGFAIRSILENYNAFSVIEKLIAHGANVNDVSPDGEGALYLLAKTFLEGERRSGRKRISIYNAIEENLRSLLLRLLNAGADPWKRDALGNTPAHLLAKAGFVHEALLLLDKMGDSMPISSEGTPTDSFIRGLDEGKLEEIEWELKNREKHLYSFHSLSENYLFLLDSGCFHDLRKLEGEISAWVIRVFSLVSKQVITNGLQHILQNPNPASLITAIQLVLYHPEATSILKRVKLFNRLEEFSNLGDLLNEF